MAGASAPAATAPGTLLVSVNAAGTAEGNGSSTGPEGPHWLSRDGRYAVFVSFADDLVTPSPPQDDIGRLYVRDIEAGTTELVTRGWNGTPADGATFDASISRDGRWVVFGSGAGNLVPGDTNFEADTFVYDRQTQVLERVSVTSDELEQNGGSRRSVAISDDGNLVAFSSTATNLAPGVDTNGVADVFLRDRAAGTTVRISNAAGTGDAANGRSGDPSISGDGDVVVFWSFATDLAGTPDPDPGLFVYDRSASSLERVADSTTVPPMVSGSGRYVTWRGFDDGLIWVSDLQTNTSEVVSINTAGAQVFGTRPSISDNGRRVSFESSETDPSFVRVVYMRDLDADVTERASLNDDGTTAPEGLLPGISGDGFVVGFTGRAAALGFPQPPSGVDVYVRLVRAPLIYIALDPPAPPETGLWAWGGGYYGQLGNGTRTGAQTTPRKVSGFTDVSAFSAGGSHNLALRSDGTVWAWGYGQYGQLGNSTPTAAQTTPVQVTGLTGVTAISAGWGHSLALRSDGTVWAWGYGGYGQLGNGTTNSQTTPVQVSGLTGVAAVSAGDRHNLALRSDGTVWAWGGGEQGQLGNGATTMTQSTPVQVTGLAGVAAVGAGGYHNLAILSDGTVWAWGYGFAGQLGNGTTTMAQTTPVQVSGLTGVAAVGAGSYHSLAVRSDGTAWAWGYGGYGQLGTGTVSYTYQETRPVRVSGLTDVAAISGGYYHSLALRSDGTAWAWGGSFGGQLGNGTLGYTATPVQVRGLTGASAIDAGGDHNLASGTASPTNGIVSGSATAPADGTVSTDVDGDGATADNPVEVAVTTPNAGTVSLATSSTITYASGYVVGGRAILVEAPEATAGDPLVLTFTLDVSVYPLSRSLDTAYIDRNGVRVDASCTGPSAADPDPCIASRTRLANGDIEIVVRTSRPSEWAVLVQGPTSDAGGPYTVGEGSSVTLAGSASGGTAPYTFLWDPVPGLDDPTVASPSFAGLDDGVFPLRLTVTDNGGIFGTDDSQVAVTNVVPAVAAIEASAKKVKVNAQLKVSAAFTDPGTLDTHTATWSWGDGKSNGGAVKASGGSGSVTGSHVFQRAGTYTITLTVRDDDGGAAQRTLVVQVAR